VGRQTLVIKLETRITVDVINPWLHNDRTNRMNNNNLVNEVSLRPEGDEKCSKPCSC
jgi:hypothetical protein